MEKAGKIDSGDFKSLLGGRFGYSRPEVVQGPRFGVDVSVVQLPGGLALAQASDPLSLLPSLGMQASAWLSVVLLANDMATTGHAPQYAQFVLNLPIDLPAADFEAYWSHIHAYCRQLGIAITGGHTGTIPGQQSTIVGGGTMTLVAPERELLCSNHARPGDLLLASKQTAMMSSAILAMSFPQTVGEKLGSESLEQARKQFYHTSVLPEGLLAGKLNRELPRIHALHDATEGGVLGGAYEMATAAGCGLLIEDALLPKGIGAMVCEAFDIDHRYSVGAGSMLMAVPPSHAERVLRAFQDEGIPVCAIGRFLEAEQGMQLQQGQHITPLQMAPDPYWGAYFKAYTAGWK